MIEIILAALFLAVTALGSLFFFAQNKVTMSSSSQVMECQGIAKQALEDVVSLGSRLYGYKINHSDANLSYTPLFIKKNGSSITDVGDGSELSFPPEMYKNLYKNLGVATPTDNPQQNTGKSLIGSTYPFEVSTSALLVNFVNALQYLYNADNGFFTDNGGKGKDYTLSTISNGVIADQLKKYQKRFDLDESSIKLYIKISPIDLTTGNEMSSPPSKILTRPRFHNPQNVSRTPALNVLGSENISFDMSVTLEYTQNDQDYNCSVMHRFSHQMKPIIDSVRKLDVRINSITSGTGKDLASAKQTSCDTDGSAGYDDITLKLDFSLIGKGKEIASVLLCRMDSYCRSYDDNGSWLSCVPTEGLWQRCHKINPKPSSDQSWTVTSSLASSSVLNVTFNDMKPDRRYDLNIAEFSMAGNMLRSAEHLVSEDGLSFYVDAKRPKISKREILGDDVGKPNDGVKDRNYTTPYSSWSLPPNSTSKWLQCNTANVKVKSGMSDQFMHNLEDCEITGSSTSSATVSGISECQGTVGGIGQARHTITFKGKDICGVGPPKPLVWDTDLPNTFSPSDVGTIWKYSPSSTTNAGNPKYPITANSPGPFPKHYSLTCKDNFIDPESREDGDSGSLECELKDGSSNDNGVNLNHVGIKYHHVCGQTECKGGSWGVYAYEGQSCEKVQCELVLSCCDASKGTCNGVGDKHCGKPNTTGCTNPKGGTQALADEIDSGCPPLGLNNCTYQLPCKAVNPFDPGYTETGPCNDLRKDQTCNFDVNGTCTNSSVGAGWQSFSPLATGTATFPGGYTETCTVDIQSRCVSGTRTECRDQSNNVISCPPTCIPPACTSTQVHDNCLTTEYKAFAKNITKNVSGTCGAPSSGSCGPKNQGGGALDPKSTHRGECGSTTDPIEEPLPPECTDYTPPPPECAPPPDESLCAIGMYYIYDANGNRVIDDINDRCQQEANEGYQPTCGVSDGGCSRGGIFQDAPDDSVSFRWNCIHPISSRLERCSRPKIIGGGVCWYVNNGCNAGLLENDESDGSDTQDTTTHYRWKCTNIQGVEDEDNVQMCKVPINTDQEDWDKAICGDPAIPGQCANGEFLGYVERSQPGTHIHWVCANPAGSPSPNRPACTFQPCRDEDAYRNKQAFCFSEVADNAVCGTAFPECIAGRGRALKPSYTHYRWQCVGLTKLETCEEDLPPDKLTGCDNDVDTCIAGYTAQSTGDPEDTDELHRWVCTDGAKTFICAKAKGVAVAGDAPRCGGTHFTCGPDSVPGDEPLHDGSDVNNPYLRWECFYQKGTPDEVVRECTACNSAAGFGAGSAGTVGNDGSIDHDCVPACLHHRIGGTHWGPDCNRSLADANGEYEETVNGVTYHVKMLDGNGVRTVPNNCCRKVASALECGDAVDTCNPSTATVGDAGDGNDEWTCTLNGQTIDCEQGAPTGVCQPDDPNERGRHAGRPGLLGHDDWEWTVGRGDPQPSGTIYGNAKQLFEGTCYYNGQAGDSCNPGKECVNIVTADVDTGRCDGSDVNGCLNGVSGVPFNPTDPNHYYWTCHDNPFNVGGINLHADTCSKPRGGGDGHIHPTAGMEVTVGVCTEWKPRTDQPCPFNN